MGLSSRPFGVGVAVGLLAAAAVDVCPAAGRPTRAEAIRRTLEAVDKQAEARGGWDAWAEELGPFREDLKRIVATEKWPWPARDDYRFYGRSLETLLVDDFDAQKPGVEPSEFIVHFDRQLKAHGIDLVFVPVPSKLSIYPDYLSEKAPEHRMVALGMKRLFRKLLESDVEVVDLYAAFREYRRARGDDVPLYYVRDGHWLNRGARLAAERVSERLKRYDFVQAALARGGPYVGVPGSRDDGMKADSDLLLVRPKGTGQPWQPSPDAAVILTGDSFSMYNMHLGGHLPAQVSLRTAVPITYLCSEGLSTGVPGRLAREAPKGYLKGRRVLVWTFTGRTFRVRERDKGEQWQPVDVPAGRSAATDVKPVRGVKASGTVAALSAPPQTDAPYANYIMKLHLADLVDEKGGPVGTGEGVVHVLAMRERKELPIARIEKGARLDVRLTSWDLVEERFAQIMTGMLVPVRIETDRPHYWGEVGPKWSGGRPTTIETRPGEDATQVPQPPSGG